MAALGVHLLLLSLVVRWTPAIVVKSSPVTEIVLVSASGLQALSAPTTPADLQPPTSTALVPPPPSSPSSVIPKSPQTVAVDPPRLVQAPPSILEKLLVSGALEPADPTAAPVALGSVPPAASQTPTAPGGSAKCQILEMLQASLGASPEVRVALLAVPRKAWSVSNALLVWNGRWLDFPGDPAVSPLDSVRQVVSRGVAASPPACQAETVTGPRLILVARGPDTFVLAFGSGDWRWGDTVEQPTVAGGTSSQ